MSNGRHKLDRTDTYILDKMKEYLTTGIEELQERGVRPANIEIELEWHIKKLLKGE